MKRAKSKVKKSAQARRNSDQTVRKAPFMEHIAELRRRLFRISASIAVFSVGAYFVQHYIVRFLLAPAEGQHFAQTTPGGGIDFLFRICLYTGIAISIPIIFQQIIGYFAPLIKKDAHRFIRGASIASWFLALAGICFGYFIGLPAALHFLLHQFSNPQIETLINLQSYLSFVLTYIIGAALLFQLPLIMLVINRIKPLKPSKLFGYERWVILAAVILGGILSPSPNVMDQVLLAGPIIATYQLGIFLVWMVNRRSRRPKKILTLREQDEAARLERLAQFEAARQALSNARKTAPVLKPTATPVVAATIVAKSITKPVKAPAAARPIARQADIAGAAQPSRARQYRQSFERRSYFTPVPGRIQ